MYRIILVSFLIVCSAAGLRAQQGFPNYYRYYAKATYADSLYTASKFRQAAEVYEEAFAIPVEKGLRVPVSEMLYNAACCWSRCGKKSDAFRCLEKLSSEYDFRESKRLETDSDLESLHSDKRWVAVVAKTAQNLAKAEKQKQAYEIRTQFEAPKNTPVFYPYTEETRKYLCNDSLPFISVDHHAFRIFFTANSYAAKHLENIYQELDDAMGRALSILSLPSWSRGSYVVLVDSPEQMQQLTGVYVHGGMASPGNDLVFFVYGGERRGQFRHELFHLIANTYWGTGYCRLLNEGSAVYADNQCYYDNPVYAIASAMQKTGRSVKLSTLIDDFDNLAQKNEVVAYLQSAAVFKYLYEQYGVEKMEQLWKNGFSKFESIYGMKTEAFEKQWTDFISAIPAPEKVDWETLLQKGCG